MMNWWRVQRLNANQLATQLASGNVGIRHSILSMGNQKLDVLNNPCMAIRTKNYTGVDFET